VAVRDRLARDRRDLARDRGSEPATFDAPGETLGIADIPVSVARNLGGLGGTVGTTIISGIEAVNAPLFEAAAFAGPASPIIIVLVIIIIETTAVLWLPPARGVRRGRPAPARRG